MFPRSEAGVEAVSDLSRLRVGPEVEALRDVAPRVFADLGIEAGVVRAGEEVLRADVHLEVAQMADSGAQPGGGYGVVQANVLAAQVRPVLDEQL